MKIERISENQIRCTLDHSDLADRQIELSELAYGSEKARRLFHELIQSAAAEVGFDVDNMPLMVEAIPLSIDTIMLIVTRVEDPDELDTRFSRFSPHTETEWEEPEELSELAGGLLEGASFLKDLAAQAAAGAKTAAPAAPASDPTSAPLPSAPSFRLFTFPSLDHTATAAAALGGVVLAQSSLYKNHADGLYYLCVRCGDNEDAFRRICNTLSEYGTLKRSAAGALAYCEEHCEVIIASRALDKLARMN